VCDDKSEAAHAPSVFSSRKAASESDGSEWSEAAVAVALTTQPLPSSGKKGKRKMREGRVVDDEAARRRLPETEDLSRALPFSTKATLRTWADEDVSARARPGKRAPESARTHTRPPSLARARPLALDDVALVGAGGRVRAPERTREAKSLSFRLNNSACSLPPTFSLSLSPSLSLGCARAVSRGCDGRGARARALSARTAAAPDRNSAGVEGKSALASVIPYGFFSNRAFQHQLSGGQLVGAVAIPAHRVGRELTATNHRRPSTPERVPP